MVSEADPSFRTGFDGRFTEVVPNELLVSTGAWGGIPGQTGTWDSNLRVELAEDGGTTRVVIREGPHPREPPTWDGNRGSRCSPSWSPCSASDASKTTNA